jgi:hypothetical protein
MPLDRPRSNGISLQQKVKNAGSVFNPLMLCGRLAGNLQPLCRCYGFKNALAFLAFFIEIYNWIAGYPIAYLYFFQGDCLLDGLQKK